MPNNSLEKSISAGSKKVQVKGRVALCHPDARNTAPGKAVRYFCVPPNFSVFSKLGGWEASLLRKFVLLRVAQSGHV